MQRTSITCEPSFTRFALSVSVITLIIHSHNKRAQIG